MIHTVFWKNCVLNTVIVHDIIDVSVVFPAGEPFVIGGNRIGARTLDLNKDFAEISAQLNAIVEEHFDR